MYRTRSYLDAVAAALDARGAETLAADLDYLTTKIFGQWFGRTYNRFIGAMSRQEAHDLLGVKPDADEDEINKAFKQKALEHHPDLGGNADMMVKLNVARDILTGKGREDRDLGPRPTSPGVPMKKREPWGDKITFEEAMQKARVPMSGVTWKWSTSLSFGGYGDTHSTGYVVYGEDEHNHIFVGVYEHQSRNMFTAEDTDTHEMWVEKVPKSQPISQAAPRVIRDLWKNFGDVKGYNAKILVFKEPTEKFSKKFEMPKGRTMSFKDAMGIMGEERPAGWTGKINIEMELSGEHESIKPKYSTAYNITLVVNGKPYALSDKSIETLFVKNGGKVMRAIFGTYFYSSSKKNLTKMTKMVDQILGYLAEKLVDEPQDLRDALMAAAIAKGYQKKAA